MEKNVRLKSYDTSEEVYASQYRHLVGRLLYLTVTRRDIAYSVNQLSQFLSKPRKTHMDVAFQVLRYLKGTPGQDLFFPSSGGLELLAYCDASWLSCPLTKRSRTGYFICLGGAPISWRTKKQSVVSRSSAESVYRAMATTVYEVLWLRWLLKYFDATQVGATPLLCDNEATRHIALNPVYHERTKHVEMDCYFVRERVNNGDVKPCAIRSEFKLADIFTNALGTDRFLFLRDKLGVRDLHVPTFGGVLRL
ncbi:secreted RxLR effector protein 161-like [Rutidosis leptorrhynchoides]|uniref:secreted RxLR effector protein 161-like n=1 Tax=Rutidosis leptorrhynchoides TaxID=125765 RepID=UPI003A9A0E90